MSDRSEMLARLRLFDGRDGEAATWSLPPWGHSLGMRIFPILVWVGDSLIPVGTAFCISRIGLVASATHNATAALRYHPRGDSLQRKEELPSNIELGDVSLAVLHAWVNKKDSLQINLWPLEGMQGAQPTDVIFGFPNFQDRFPYLPLKLSLALPRIGSKVYAVGYSKAEVAGGAISVDALRTGEIRDWAGFYKHDFQVVEGRVSNIFLQGFAPSYLRGACFTIDAAVESGMSGGPVFNEAGDVCGVVSATACRFFEGPTSLISLFYPALMTGIKFGLQFGPGRIDATHPLIALIEHGTIETDGTENLVHFFPEEDGWRVGPLIHKDDSDNVFDDFPAYQEGRRASREIRKVLRRVRRTADDADGAG